MIALNCKPERIIAAAFVSDAGFVFYLPRPKRHHDILGHVWRMGIRSGTAGKHQGFLTDRWRYVDRVEGLSIATIAGQIVHKHGQPYELYSEDMW